MRKVRLIGQGPLISKIILRTQGRGIELTKTNNTGDFFFLLEDLGFETDWANAGCPVRLTHSPIPSTT